MKPDRFSVATGMGQARRSGRRAEVTAALFLVGAGVVFLLHNLGLAPALTPLLWGVLLIAGGLAFLLPYLAGRMHWWPLIPGLALLGAGAMLLLGATRLVPDEVTVTPIFLCLAVAFAAIYSLNRRQNWWALLPGGAMLALTALLLLGGLGSDELAGAAFFLGLGLAFVALYFVEIDGKRHNWWTLLPAGALFSLALVIALSGLGEGEVAGAFLFLGMGATFGLLYLLRGPDKPLGWAWIPAVALLGFGALVLFIAGNSLLARAFWPLALIAAGVALIVVNLRRAKKGWPER